MKDKTEITKKQLSDLFSKYDLGRVEEMKILLDGTVQTNIFLKTEKGKYVFRLYENRLKESVVFEIDLIKYLNRHNYPCPHIYKNKHGEYMGEFKEKPYAVFEFIEGEHLENQTEEEKIQLIQKVAELQNITKGFVPLNKEYRWNYNSELCRKLAGDEAAESGTDNSIKKRLWLESELSKLNIPDSLPKGICHCDFHFSNVLFHKGEFKALLDFDDANYTYMLFDLVWLIDPFIPGFDWDSWENYSPSDNVFDFREPRQIVESYSGIRPLSTDEKEAFFDLYKLSVLFDCIWYFERGDVGDFFEKRKIDYLNRLGSSHFYNGLFR